MKVIVMNTKQVWFFYKQGLLNPKLIQKFELKHGNLERVHDQLKITMNIFQFIEILILAVLALSLAEHFFTNLSALQIASICLLVLLLFLHQALNYTQFTIRLICNLNSALGTYNDDSGCFRKYHLHMDYDWLIERAKYTIARSAYLLVESELTRGMDDELTIRARNIFKHTHATFVQFDLCEENQGVYIREAQEKAHDALFHELDSVLK